MEIHPFTLARRGRRAVVDFVGGCNPPNTRRYWHDHKHKGDAGLLESLTQTGEGEKKTLVAVRPLWGKVDHT